MGTCIKNQYIRVHTIHKIIQKGEAFRSQWRYNAVKLQDWRRSKSSTSPQLPAFREDAGM